MLLTTETEKRSKLKINKPLVYEKVIKYEDKVAKGESAAMIVLNYDYICNFRCNHCSSNNLMIRDLNDKKLKANKKYLTPEIVKDIYEQGDKLGFAHTSISGGEPLLYSDLENVIKAINPNKWWIAIDTNGWFLNDDKAKYLKSIGVDKVQISLDSFIEKEHDTFRNKSGAYSRVMYAIDSAKKADLSVLIMTTVWKERVKSQELLDLLEFTKSKEISTYITLAKPIGSWAGNLDVLCGDEEISYIKELEKQYDLTTRFSSRYGLDLGCIAMKRSITITKYGDVMPCPYIQTSVGNIFDEPLKDIMDRGLGIKYFSFKNKYTCLSGNKDFEFVKKYMPKIWTSKDPIKHDLVFDKEDYE